MRSLILIIISSIILYPKVMKSLWPRSRGTVQPRSVGAAPSAREGSRSRAGPVGPGSRKSSASPKVDGPRGARSHAGARAIAPGVAGPAGRRQRRGGHSLGRAARRAAVSRLEPELSIGQVQKGATKKKAY